MRTSLQPRRTVRLGLAALTLALELALIAPSPTFAEAVPQAPAPAQSSAPDSGDGLPCPGSMGPADYPVSGGETHGGGWFYTEEACAWAPIMGVGPARARGFAVLDDDRANFWTEFRRFGGVDVLGYPVSEPYHYPVGGTDGYWYQAFERGILQYHPETGRAEMANVFEQFTEADLDRTLMYLGIPGPQSVAASTDASFDPEQRMGWLTEPKLLARYFFDPVGFHSSEPWRPGQTSFATQEQAWAFFGLPQGPAERMVLRERNTLKELWPLVHSFMAQRFQKGGLELFMEDLPPTQEEFDRPLLAGDDGGILFDPTIVPGDGKKGCVALTAVGLLAREIGINKIIPRDAIEPRPLDSHPSAYFTTYIPPVTGSNQATSFQVTGTGFVADEPITITLKDGVSPGTATAGTTLPSITLHVDHAYSDGSFIQVGTARVGTYTLTATGDKSGKSHDEIINLGSPTLTLLNRQTTCKAVGLPVGS